MAEKIKTLIRIINGKTLRALLLLSGMIIGVGMFGIPFVFSRAGFLLGSLELFFLTGVVVFFHLIFGEIVLRTAALHRLPGYVGIYLGNTWKIVSTASYLFGIAGAMFAYVLLGGKFLSGLSGLDAPFASLLFIAGAIIITFFNLSIGVWANYILTILLIGFIFFLSSVSVPHASFANLTGFSPSYFFLPYGVLLFALSGSIVIPEMAAFLGEERAKLKKSIFIGSVIPAIVYFFFAFGVVGALGSAVSEDAISGLLPLLGGHIVFLGDAIGFLATFTSFVMLGFVFGGMLKTDFGFHRVSSWFIASMVPIILFFGLGAQNFIVVIGTIGAVAIGIDSMLTIATYIRAKTAGARVPEYSIRLSKPVLFSFGAMFIVGAFYQIYILLFVQNIP